MIKTLALSLIAAATLMSFGVSANAAQPIIPHTTAQGVGATMALSDSCMSADIHVGVLSESTRHHTGISGMSEISIAVEDSCQSSGPVSYWLGPDYPTTLPTVARDLSTGSWWETFADYTISSYVVDPVTGEGTWVSRPMPFTLSGVWVARGPISKSVRQDRTGNAPSRMVSEYRPADVQITLTVNGHTLTGVGTGGLEQDSWFAK